MRDKPRSGIEGRYSREKPRGVNASPFTNFQELKILFKCDEYEAPYKYN